MAKKIEHRKRDHLLLAKKSQAEIFLQDQRFDYEPLLMPCDDIDLSSTFLGKKLLAPIWISSVTGGTKIADKINFNFSKAVAHHKIGFALGSCRFLLENPKLIKKFLYRDIIGKENHFWANLGIAQIEDVVSKNDYQKIEELIEMLDADGLVIHVNPLQEWLQKEGDKIKRVPIKTIEEFLLKFKYPVIVKEVGQGMGQRSLTAVLKLPIKALEFAAFGGTNFSKLEMLRSSDKTSKAFNCWEHVGHSAYEMIEVVRSVADDLGKNLLCKSFILSGGINNHLDGFYLLEKFKEVLPNMEVVYGQAFSFLNKAQKSSPNDLIKQLSQEIEGLKMAHRVLKIKG